jgi:hypothetical protein
MPSQALQEEPDAYFSSFWLYCCWAPTFFFSSFSAFFS